MTVNLPIGAVTLIAVTLILKPTSPFKKNLSPKQKILQLDPLGTLASGALLIAVALEHAPPLVAALAAEGIGAAAIGRLLPPGEGAWLLDDGVRRPLPTFEVDEITRLF